MLRERAVRLFRARALVVALSLLAAVGCKETGTVQVSSLTFSGNSGIDDASLKAVISTQESGFLPWSKQHYFDRTEFDRDVQRIEAYYKDHGYPNAKVTGVDVQLNQAKDKVSIKVNITEGKPIIVESVSLEGLDAIPAAHLAELKSELPIAVGQPRNQTLILASHDLVLNEMKDHGFPYGTVRVVERPGSAPDRVQLAVQAETGPHATFGAITVEGVTSVSQDVVLRELAFQAGDEYQLNKITESQRRLYQMELFQFANITPKLPENKAPEVPVTVVVAEGKHRKLQASLGYGSEEKLRTKLSWRHVNFGGGARTFDSEAKWSSLEKGFRGSFTEPYLFQPGVSLRLEGSTWWTSEPTYVYRSEGGRATITKQFSRGAAGVERGTRNEVRATLINEFENYTISEEALQDPSLTDDFIALGLNPVTGKGHGRLSAVEIDYDRDTSGQPLDPHRGYLLSTHLESGHPWLGGDFSYNEIILEGRKYFQFGKSTVWASRARAGTLAGSNPSLIPFFKRYYEGGSTSVRGWGRYQISPLSENGTPIGGRSMSEVSTELRFPVVGQWSGVAFVDGGNVSAGPWEVPLSNLRWAVGVGVRYNTRIGPLRVDFGQQLNPIPGLLINGQPETRTWRVHFSIGQAF